MTGIAYSVTQAAAAVGLSEKVIRSEIRLGNLPVKYYGTKILVPRVELERWLAGLPEQKD